MQQSGMQHDAPVPFHPLAFPQCLEPPGRVNAISWQEHIPFAKALVQMLRPKVFVELGVHTGDSYLAFCEAAAALKLDIACSGVDTWRGDPQAGLYGPEVLAELQAYHDPRYGKFSRLVQATFDEALAQFADGSIDLLHIDGTHTYEAVRHDWETWRGKLSRRGVVLFHDVNVRERDFGVWRLWEEIKGQYSHFEFTHGYGLGVLAVGPDTPPELATFLKFGKEQPELLRSFFFSLGNRITLQAQLRKAQSAIPEYDALCRARGAEIERLNAKILEYDALCRARGAEIERLNAKITEYDALCRARGTAIEKLDARILEYDALCRARGAEIEQLNARISEYDVALRALEASQRAQATRIEQLQGQVVSGAAQLASLQEERARIVGGASFRIGRAITAPARLLLRRP